ncbi:amidohydrolase [Pedobacter insulae]|uniref:Carboxypeptidase Ss1. Metallo peptidase. MEROPS family M20D n=1 Tax=Pedobacter insulae TaxID=414048 RepID=A0A1I2YWX9_9SPHI|nr:amidohydrolase [Pedobacter insulae]SFH30124.1 carboxypeptidase Ss1. Metallo peptidase. MEROPS family M20D [Pedobacter insulae]
MKRLLLSTVLIAPLFLFAQKATLKTEAAKRADALTEKVIAWRRDFHEHPELGNLETRTAGIVADHLRKLGIEVKTGVAKTGVVGVLVGGKPGPVVALRADMDGLPVTERVQLPFASKVKTMYNGQEVGVMHACGHDSHVAMLMGVAEVLAGIKKDLAGTVKFIFQPAEEGVPVGEEGGAELMVKEGVLQNPKVDVIFGLHINSQTPVGDITYRPGGTMAAVNDMKITVTGQQAHGAYPWSSIDPIVVAAQIVTNLQTIVSRNLNITENPGVVTIGSIQGGVRSNIIPEKVEMLGTVRNFSAADEKMFIERIKTIVTNTGEAAGAKAEVLIPYSSHYPVTFNDLALTEKMLPSLQQTAGAANVKLKPPVTGAEDFSFYQEKVPGLFFFLGAMPKGNDPLKTASHHTPDFFLDESSFNLGVKAMINLTLDYMSAKK